MADSEHLSRLSHKKHHEPNDPQSKPASASRIAVSNTKRTTLRTYDLEVADVGVSREEDDGGLGILGADLSLDGGDQRVLGVHVHQHHDRIHLHHQQKYVSALLIRRNMLSHIVTTTIAIPRSRQLWPSPLRTKASAALLPPAAPSQPRSRQSYVSTRQHKANPSTIAVGAGGSSIS
eukprot:3586094-Rhodomonas_salina.2